VHSRWFRTSFFLIKNLSILNYTNEKKLKQHKVHQFLSSNNLDYTRNTKAATLYWTAAMQMKRKTLTCNVIQKKIFESKSFRWLMSTLQCSNNHTMITILSLLQWLSACLQRAVKFLRTWFLKLWYVYHAMQP
jgi:hypothetical protein